MKNCHKRWKREKKEERLALLGSADRTKEGMEDLLFFFKKHPDQGLYELEQIKKLRKILPQ